MTQRLARSAGRGSTGRTLAIVAVLSLVVAGCGGGSDGDDGPRSPTVSLSASPTILTLFQSTTLTWTASAGTSCTATGGWAGTKAPTGSETVTPDATGSVTYTLSCSGGDFDEDGTASATVTVEPPSAYSSTALVADTAGTGAVTTDASVANAWGLAFLSTSSLGVANNRTNTSTFYDGNGRRQPMGAPLVVRLPPPGRGVHFEPTGIVFNATSGFVVSASGPARFIFAGEGGAIAGWTSAVDVDDAVFAYVADDGARYTGLAIGTTGAATYLYAADFANGKVDVFDATYARQPQSGASFAFTDPDLPAGYAPFGIQAIATGPGGATQIYVSYARKGAGSEVEPGAGSGVVNVFDANGVFVKRLVSDGAQLNAPWGMALAPADFGTLSGALLVGNSGSGRIHGFDPSTGEYLGPVANAAREPFGVPGLRGIAFGNDNQNQPHATLFYAAGTNGEVNGEVGRIDLGETPPVLNAPPVVAITAPSGTVSGTISVAATASSDTSIATVQFFAGSNSLGTVFAPPYTVEWNTTTVPNGTVALTATATDTSGNVGTSPPVTVTVSN
ncbi:MAG: hypothetical protein K0R70_1201 [Steroidobacteraceae bacterium]|nr:hypothetical protein [Steroidobacteraceae bacterium]